MRFQINDRTKRALTVAAEIALVLLIVALLVATWMPAFVGARPAR